MITPVFFQANGRRVPRLSQQSDNEESDDVGDFNHRIDGRVCDARDEFLAYLHANARDGRFFTVAGLRKKSAAGYQGLPQGCVKKQLWDYRSPVQVEIWPIVSCQSFLQALLASALASDASR